jgi:hypothetical protein
VAAERTFKLDIFDLLSKIDRGDLHIWDKLSEDERKGFAPLVVMRWMSGVTEARQIVYLNELINPLIFQLGKHPDLLMKLLAACSSKKQRRYFWLAASKKKAAKKLEVQVLQEYYGYSERVAKQQLPLLDGEDILTMAEELGWQKDELAKLKKEIKAD